MGGDAESLWLAGGLARTEKAGERCGSRCLFAPSALEESPWAHLHVVGMLQFMSNINQLSLPTPFYSLLVSMSVFMAHSTVFHSINSSDNSPFSDSVLPVLSLPYWSFQLYIS